MTTILIVDDSHLEQRLVAGLLGKNSDFEFQFASNGVDALARIRQQTPDLVVTDLVMPEMDGLKLVRSIRIQYPALPTILLTAYENDSTAADALERGAVSFVPKVQQAERLFETVQRVLARVATEHRKGPGEACMMVGSFSYCLGSDPSQIVPLIELVQQTLAAAGTSDANGRIRICLALEEALSNALLHGNLEISAQELADARATGGDDLPALIERRRASPRLRDRTITVDVHVTHSGARFAIRDQGPGFDLATWVHTPEADAFERGRSRGLVLMRSLVDDLDFNERGNEVTLFTRGHHRIPILKEARARHRPLPAFDPSVARRPVR